MMNDDDDGGGGIGANFALLHEYCIQIVINQYICQRPSEEKKRKRERKTIKEHCNIIYLFHYCRVLASQTSSLPSFLLLQEGEGGKCFW